MRVTELDGDKPRLAEFLSRDPVAAVYQIGDLDPVHDPHCRWWGAEDDAGLRALLLRYGGLRVPAVLTAGDDEGVAWLLGRVWDELGLPFFAHIRRGHQTEIDRRLGAQALTLMYRMRTDREAFDDTAPRQAEGLTADQLPEIEALFGHYPGHFFVPEQLALGHYFGVRAAGRLVSIAGTHVVAEARGLAAIGNIVTHPDHRGRGYATRCTARLVHTLLGRIPTIALNVAQDNAAAVSIYRKLGFVVNNDYVEGLVSTR